MRKLNALPTIATVTTVTPTIQRRSWSASNM